MILSAVAAMARNRVIGVNGTLPWDLPEDMKFFRDKTMGKVMIMGRKTYESFPKPLPRRHHIVITRQADYQVNHPSVEVVSSLKAAVARAKEMTSTSQWPDEVAVVGGGEIYLQSLPILDRIYLTVIEQDFEGDAKFPEFDESVFKLKHCEEKNGPPAFSFRLYAKD